jgi:hypothetical protein
MREPSLYQSLLAWAFFMAPRIGLKRWPWRVLLLIGMLGTLSTGGLGVLVGVWLITYVIMRAHGRKAMLRQLVGILAFGGAIWLATAAPVVGLSTKQVVNSASVNVRTTSTLAGLNSLIVSPFGSGSSSPNAGINAISDATFIGIPGLLFALLAYGRPIRLSRERILTLSTALPLILASLITEPVLDAGTWWILILLSVLPYEGLSDFERSRGQPAEVT